MKKKSLFSLIVLFSWIFTAQELPTIIPPSPEATSLAKFIEIPVSHYTGLPNITIPIHTIHQSGMNIPVSLSYHARGIQVSEISSRVGLGWALNYGGSISRQIRGKADDDNARGYLNEDFLSTIYNDKIVQLNVYNAETTPRPYDLIPDVFYFNANGISGKFIFDQRNGLPLIQKFNDIKIDYSRDRKGKIESFLIVDNLGNKYYYGISKDGSSFARNYQRSINNMEYSEPGGGIKYLPNEESDYYYSSWLLMDIETPEGISIKFHYEQEEAIYYNRTHDEYKKEEGAGNPKILKSFFSKIKSYQQMLKKIEFPEGEILFYRSLSEREDLNGAYVLDKVQVLNINFKQIKEFNFNYQYTTDTSSNNVLDVLYRSDSKAQKRLFLKSIIEKDSMNNALPEYSFQYNTTKLPSRFSNSQDAWGYYNGAQNGSFLTFYNYNGIVNRRVDSVKSEAGLLKQIKYPTGGYTKFTYEQNKVIPPDYYKNLKINPTNPIVRFSNGLSHLESQFYNGFEYLKSISIGEKIKGTVAINTFLNDSDGCSSIGLLPSCKFQVSIHRPGQALPIYMGNSTFNLSPGEYTLRVIPKNHIHDPYNLNHGFNIVISWVEESITQNNLIYGAGKRIKKVEYKELNDAIKIKEYEYIDSLGVSSGKLFGLPNYTTVREIPDTGMTGIDRYGVIPGSPLNVPQGNSVGYSHVIEYNGVKDNNIGKIEYEFTTFQDAGLFYTFPYHFPVDNEWIRGKTISEKYFKKNNSHFYLVEEIANQYLFGNEPAPSFFTDTPLSYKPPRDNWLKDRTKFILPLFIFMDKSANFKVYYQSGGTLDLLRTHSKKYYENGNVSTSIKNYFYNYDKHYQLKKTKETLSQGEEIITERNYSQDKLFLTAAEEKLRNSHRFIPLETITYKDTNSNNVGDPTELLSRVNTSYKDWGNNVVLPKKIQASKGKNTLEDRIIYHSYDNKGNPLEVSKKDGTHIVYIWGYQQSQPIAKIENATFSQVEFAMRSLPEGHNSLLKIQTLSNIDNDRKTDIVNSNGSITKVGKEGNLREAFRNLRMALPNAQVTTFTYDPLIGVTSVTDPRGQTVYYQYDAFNRLESVKDSEGNMVSKNEYNYKN